MRARENHGSQNVEAARESLQLRFHADVDNALDDEVPARGWRCVCVRVVC
jgi:hypothetical protein